MNRAELAKETGVSDEVMKSIFKTIKAKVKAGEKVDIAGFGSFQVADRAARNARNPITGEPVAVPAKKVPKFKASKTFKDELN